MTELTVSAGKNYSNNLLRRDIRFLGNILGEVLVHQGGNELLDIVEKIRETSKSLRAVFLPELFEDFKSMIASLEPEIRHQVIRAFAIYFQLVNIAEQNHRIRRKRDYERSAGESIQIGTIERDCDRSGNLTNVIDYPGYFVRRLWNTALAAFAQELSKTVCPTRR